MWVVPGAALQILLVSIILTYGQASKIGYQIHSVNDLREWEVLIARKRARSFKVDPHWVEQEGEEGLLVLSHNQPLPPYSSYDGLNDILQLLGKFPIKNIVRTECIQIALCFKNVPFTSDLCELAAKAGLSSSSSAWFKAVDDFFALSQKVLVQEGLQDQVSFVLDGGGVPVGCLKQQWRPWVSVWTNETTCPPEAFLSNDVDEGFDRFTILNDRAIEALWKQLANLQYGKFLKASYPFQIWETGVQERIKALIGIYENSSISHPSGLSFAINIDPAMFEVFSSDQRQRVLGPGSNAAAVVVGTKEESSDLVFLLVDRKNSSYRIVMVKCPVLLGKKNSLQESELFYLPRFPGDQDPNKGIASLSSPASASDGGISHLLLSTEMGEYLVYEHDHTHPTHLVLKDSGIFSSSADPGKTASPPLSRQSLASCLLSVKEDGAYVMMELYLSSSNIEDGFSCLAYQVLLKEEGKAIRSIANDCLSNTMTSSVESASIVVLHDDDQKGEGKHQVIIFFSASKKVFATLLDLRTRHRSNSIVQIGVGTKVDAKSIYLPSRKQSFIMLLTGDSFCFNSFHKNKSAARKICDLDPISTPEVLAYTHAEEESWRVWLSTSTYPDSKRVITSCTPLFTYGTYDSGSDPALLLHSSTTAKDADGVDEEVHMLSIHNGYTGGERARACGHAIPRSGLLVLDRFSVHM